MKQSDAEARAGVYRIARNFSLIATRRLDKIDASITHMFNAPNTFGYALFGAAYIRQQYQSAGNGLTRIARRVRARVFFFAAAQRNVNLCADGRKLHLFDTIRERVYNTSDRVFLCPAFTEGDQYERERERKKERKRETRVAICNIKRTARG